MKKVVLLSWLLLTISYSFSQNIDFGVEAGGGFGTYGGLGYLGLVVQPNKLPFRVFNPTRVKRDKSNFDPNIVGRKFIKLSAHREKGSGKGVDYLITGLDLSLHYTLLSNDYLFLTLKGGGTISSNKLETAIQEEPTSSETSEFKRTKTGVLVGGEFEYLFAPKFIMVSGFDQRFFFDDSDVWGHYRWYVYVGLKFHFASVGVKL